ncbi:MAG: hypothetical protein ACLS63_04220 [Flavonifractor plautii]
MPLSPARRPVMPAGGKVVDFTAYRQAAHPEEYARGRRAPAGPGRSGGGARWR